MQDLQFAVDDHLTVANTDTAGMHSVFADDVAPSALAVLTRDDLNALIETGRELAEEMALDRLLQTILQAASRLTASPDSSVILKSETQPTLYIASATGEQADWILATYGRHSEKQIPIKGSKAGEVFTSGRSLIANVVKGHFTGVDLIAQQTTRSMVCVPLT
ncbi:MAG TPA: GAF domain-containing protein, partial [Pirellulales bacterium]|nr:GAF domain-containing protein [Pirellulales bacterium]